MLTSRASVATTVPNFVRGSINILTPLFLLFKDRSGIIDGAALLGLLTMLTACLSLCKKRLAKT